MIPTLASLILAPALLQAALRALLAALAVWAGLRLLRVGNVLVQKAAWGLVLLAALAMPLAPRWLVLPTSAALRLPALPWTQPATPTAVPSPDRYPSPFISNANQVTPQLSHLLVSPVEDPLSSPSTFASVSSAPRVYVKLNHHASQRSSRSLNAAGHEMKNAAIALNDPSATSNSAAVSAPTITIDRTPTSAPNGSAPQTVTRAAIVWSLYLAVFAALFLRLVLGLASALRLWTTAEPIPDHPGLRSSPRVSSPVNIGSGIILPADYTDWDEEKLRIVLAHERSHIRQGDFYLQVVASVYATLFWFSPLGWWLKRKLSELSEAISDRAGLEQAASRSSYAQLLLEFAALPRPTLTGVAMARTSHLSQRIERLLNEHSFRHAFAAGGRRALLAVLLVPAAIFAATALVRVEAAAAPTAQTPSAVTGQSTPQQVTNSEPASPATPAANQDAAQVPSPNPAPHAITPEPAAPPVPHDPAAVVVVPNPPSAPGARIAPVPPLPPDPRVTVIVKTPDGFPFSGKDEFTMVMPRVEAFKELHEVLRDDHFPYYFSSGDPYAVVGDPGTRVRFAGDWEGDRSQDVEKARKIAHGHFLLFRHDRKTYLVDDPTIVNQVEAMNKPVEDLHVQMDELSKQMRELGQQQRDQAKQMREVTIQTPDLSKELAELNAAAESLKSKQGGTISQKDLGELQRQIGQIQGHLGALQGKIAMQESGVGIDKGKFSEMGKLGGQMGKLGAQIGQTARENDEKIKGIITDSISNGKAHPVE